MKKNKIVELQQYNKNEITFFSDDKWIMKISNLGLKFNREDHPNWDCSDFSNSIINILENEFNLKFIEKLKE